MKKVSREFELDITFKELYISDLTWIFGGINRRVRDVIKNEIRNNPNIIIDLAKKYEHPIKEDDMYFYQTGLIKATNMFIDVEIITFEKGSLRSKLIVGIPTFLLAAGTSTFLTGGPEIIMPVGLIVFILTEIAEEYSEEIERRIFDWVQNLHVRSIERGKREQEISTEIRILQ